jgi:hypothetical protein
MKGSDFFKKVNEPLGITLPDDVLAKLGEVELPDDLQTKFGEVFISKERAKHDNEIIEHITKEDRKNNFRIVDEKIKTLLPLVSTEHQNVINNTFETYKKMDILKTALEDARKNEKGKVSEDVQKVENEWAEKLKAQKDDHLKALAALDAQNRSNQFEWIVTSKLHNYNLADQFAPIKEQLTKLAILDLNKTGYIYEVENGQVAIRQEKDGVKRDVFLPGSETKLTLESQLDKFIDPFVKKNNTDGKKEEQKTSGGKEQQKTTTTNTGESLRDRMMANAG